MCLLLDQSRRLNNLLWFGNCQRELLISGSDFYGCPERKHMVTNTGRTLRWILNTAVLRRFDHRATVVADDRFRCNGLQDFDGRWKTLKVCCSSGHGQWTGLNHCHGWRPLGSLMIEWGDYFLLQRHDIGVSDLDFKSRRVHLPVTKSPAPSRSQHYNQQQLVVISLVVPQIYYLYHCR